MPAIKKSSNAKAASTKKATAKPAVKKAVKPAEKKATTASAVKSDVKKPVAKKAAAVKPSPKKAVKPVVKKVAAVKTVKAPVKKPAAKKAPVAKAAAGAVAVKKAQANKPAAAKKSPAKKSAAPKAAKNERDADSIENLIVERDIEIKSVEEMLGIKNESSKGKPIIPGKFDLLIPPGVPRKIIVGMAKEFGCEIVQRNDAYVPIGVSDIQRELLAIRGDEKTVKKMEKILFKRLKEWAA